jgi:hypothetical protein
MTSNPSIKKPKAVDESLNVPPRSVNPAEQGMTGVQVFANRCKHEELPACSARRAFTALSTKSRRSEFPAMVVEPKAGCVLRPMAFAG